MSSPYRAVDRQCTRRSPSPTRYARGITSSSPAAAVILVRPSPSLDQLPLTDALVSGITLGVTVSMLVLAKSAVSSTRPKTSAILIRMRPHGELAAHVGPKLIADLARPAALDAVDDVTRPRAE